jgi:hypothetical protein
VDVAVVKKVPAPGPATSGGGPGGLLRLLGLAVVLCGAAWGLTACFNPQQPGCAFSCASDGICPAGYSCQSDRLCHRTDGQGTCAVTHLGDAGGDGQPGDAAPSGAAHDGPGAD